MRFSFHRNRLVLALLLGAIATGGARTLRAQSQTVAGDLSVGGVVDVNGNSFTLGSWAQMPAKFGFSTQFYESSDHVSATVYFNQTSTRASWIWRGAQDAQGTLSFSQMELGPDGALSLFYHGGPPNIYLSPIPNDFNYIGGTLYLNGSLYLQSLNASGTNNQMPAQAVTSPASVLTAGLGDARYATRGAGSGTTLGSQSTTSGFESSAIGNRANASGLAATSVGNGSTASGLLCTSVGHAASATGDYSAAFGEGTVASGAGSVAMGIGSQATALYALAVGYGASASGMGSAAFGFNSNASGYTSVALGYAATASGFESNALGIYSTASNAFALTLGCYATASGYFASALGENSVASGEQSLSLGSSSGASGWGAASIGYHSSAGGLGAASLGTYSNAWGTFATALSYASVASGDYSVAVGRTAATSMYQMAVGSYSLPGGSATTWVATDDLFTVGNGQSASTPSNAFSVKKNGDATVAGKLAVAGPIIIQNPQGDLAMGEFTAHP